MDVYILDKANATYLPTSILQNWSSLIWTERYRDPGDFEIQSAYVAETMAAIPVGSFISLDQTDQVMMVETFDFDEDGDGAEVIIVKGRTLDVFLDNRIFTGDYGSSWSMGAEYTVQVAALITIWNTIANNLGFEVSRDYVWDHLVRDNLPNVVVTSSIDPTQRDVSPVGDISDLRAVKEWWLKVGEVYPQVKEILDAGDLGIRVLRPSKMPFLYEIFQKFTAYGPGNVQFENYDSVNSPYMHFNVYNGVKRTDVTLSYEMGHIKQPRSQISRAAYKNVIHTQSSLGGSLELQNGEAGWDLYMEYLDAGTVDPNLDPAAFQVALEQRARAEYERKREVRILDSASPANLPIVYGRDFYLGDVLRVEGKYDTAREMLVSEFIRSVDASGVESSYPTFTVPTA